MKQLLFKMWSFPHAETGWLLPGHTKLLQGKQDPLWMSYSLTKACKEIRCWRTRKASCGWRKAKYSSALFLPRRPSSYLQPKHTAEAVSVRPFSTSPHTALEKGCFLLLMCRKLLFSNTGQLSFHFVPCTCLQHVLSFGEFGTVLGWFYDDALFPNRLLYAQKMSAVALRWTWGVGQGDLGSYRLCSSSGSLCALEQDAPLFPLLDCWFFS